MTELETARLRLREMNETDAPFLLEVLNEPAFVRNVGDRGVRTLDDAVQYLRERVTASYEKFGFGSWLVEAKDTGEPLGICGLIKRDALEDVDLGFSFLERFWSRGFAYEAAKPVLDYGWRVAKLSRIVAIVAPHNAASIRLLEKLGFHFEKKVHLVPEGPELMLMAIAPLAEKQRGI
jgi:RimJ/RimL family protein N-acetyltransferase